MSDTPKFLYKYKSVSEDYIKEISEKIKEIYFADPSEFRDAYDCIYHMIRPDGLSERSQIILNGLKPFGVYCLTEKPDDIYMWSEYTDGHEGICIEYNICECDLFNNEKNRGILQKVEYSDGGDLSIRSKLSQHLDSLLNEGKNDEAINILFHRKYVKWSSELEWRSVRYLDNLKGPIRQPTILHDGKISQDVKRVRTINPNTSIKSIIFGAEMPPKTKSDIYSAIGSKYAQIEFREAQFSEKMVYEMDVSKIYHPE